MLITWLLEDKHVALQRANGCPTTVLAWSLWIIKKPWSFAAINLNNSYNYVMKGLNERLRCGPRLLRRWGKHSWQGRENEKTSVWGPPAASASPLPTDTAGIINKQWQPVGGEEVDVACQLAWLHLGIRAFSQLKWRTAASELQTERAREDVTCMSLLLSFL